MRIGLLYAMKGEIESLLTEETPRRQENGGGRALLPDTGERGRLLRRRGQGERCHGHPAVYRPVRAGTSS